MLTRVYQNVVASYVSPIGSQALRAPSHRENPSQAYPFHSGNLLAGNKSSAFYLLGLLPFQDGFDASLNVQKAGNDILGHARVVGDEGVFRSDSPYGCI